MDFPAHDHAAKDIEHQVQPVELTTHGGRQESNVPGPDLARGARPQACGLSGLWGVSVFLWARRFNNFTLSPA